MIPIVIISGFLGSGKTTFLQHILKEHKSTDKILIIENDFGETSLDAVNLAKSGATVREVTSGCICCSLQGNFQQALLDILQNYEIDVIYIEPSGVSKLSEIIHTCRMKKLQNPPMCTLQLRPLMQCRHLCLSKTLGSSLKTKSPIAMRFS